MNHRFLNLLVVLLLLQAFVVSARSLPGSGKPYIAILGDSNTWIGGDDCSNPRGWNHWFAGELPQVCCRSYARSGATWSHVESTVIDTVENVGRISDNNVISNQIARMIGDVKAGRTPVPDVVIVACGTNDAWFPKFRHLALDSDTASCFTVAGAVRSDCRTIIGAIPSARILLLTPLQSTAFSPERLDSVTVAIALAARSLGIQCVEQRRVCPVVSVNESRAFRLTTDGTHTSDEGARLCGKIIAEIVKPLLSATEGAE